MKRWVHDENGIAIIREFTWKMHITLINKKIIIIYYYIKKTVKFGINLNIHAIIVEYIWINYSIGDCTLSIYSLNIDEEEHFA